MTRVPLSAIAQAARASAPLLGGERPMRLVLVDGPAGSGKTTLANRIVASLGGDPSPGPGTFDHPRAHAREKPAQVLHADDMYEGWDGLETLDAVLVDQVLRPLSAGRDASFRMWDWEASARTHEIPVPVRPYLVIEGVGVGREAARRLAGLLVWVEAPADVRLRRGLERDGESMRDEWLRWQPREDAHFAADGTRAAADVVVDGAVPLPD